MKTLHTYITLLLAVVILGISFQNAVIQVSFDINQDYIASALCVNKTKPELNCKGKCYLNKQLSQSERDQQERPQSQLTKQTVNWLHTSHTALVPVATATYIRHYNTVADSPYWGFFAEIDHPPT